MPGPDGRPWHSWRVLILKHAPRPYSELYRAYRFDEPWDGPHNARLAGRIGDFYRRRGVDAETSDRTSFVAVVGPATAWPGAGTRARDDLRDGPAGTILIVETRDADIPWMKPDDLPFDRMSFRVNDSQGRGPGSRISGARVLLANGHVLELSDTFPPATLRSMLTIDGGEVVDVGLDSAGAKLIDAPTGPGSSR